MKARPLTLPLVCFTVLTFSAVSTRSQTVITFDDLPLNTDDSLVITNGYQGLMWSNFLASNAILYTQRFGSNGYFNGMLSVSNVAFNGNGNPAEVSSSANINFLSAYLTGSWDSNLNIEVQGYGIGGLLYDTTVVASATSPTLFTFNYLDIDRLRFNSSGGQNAGFSGNGEQFVMDNFMLEFIPEPSSFLLAATGGVLLVVFLRRRRA